MKSCDLGQWLDAGCREGGWAVGGQQAVVWLSLSPHALSPPLPQPQFPHLHNEGLLSQLWQSLRPGLRALEVQGLLPTGSVGAHVGSLAKFRKRQTLPMVPFCSKSDLKNLAVSMFTWTHSRERWRRGQAPPISSSKAYYCPAISQWGLIRTPERDSDVRLSCPLSPCSSPDPLSLLFL